MVLQKMRASDDQNQKDQTPEEKQRDEEAVAEGMRP